MYILRTPLSLFLWPLVLPLDGNRVTYWRFVFAVFRGHFAVLGFVLFIFCASSLHWNGKQRCTKSFAEIIKLKLF